MPKNQKRKRSRSISEEVLQQGFYEVEKLVKVRKIENIESLGCTRGKYGIKKPNYSKIVYYEYLVKWKGYDDADNSTPFRWEPEVNLLCEQIMKKFWDNSNIDKDYMIPGVEYDPEVDSVGPEPGSSTEDDSETDLEPWSDHRSSPESPSPTSTHPDAPKQKLFIRIPSPTKRRRVEEPKEPDEMFEHEPPDIAKPTFSIDERMAIPNPNLEVTIPDPQPYIPPALESRNFVSSFAAFETLDMVPDDYILWVTETPPNVPILSSRIDHRYFDTDRSMQLRERFLPMRPPNDPEMDAMLTGFDHRQVGGEYQAPNSRMALMPPPDCVSSNNSSRATFRPFPADISQPQDLEIDLGLFDDLMDFEHNSATL
ncbi:hypothetical protein BJ165DRAFT_1597420 [Panaeolus papilionaceus]|nr:hypothetical protein BJ165DRAFT_1597420 [Panaeolus papilionaceus]